MSVNVKKEHRPARQNQARTRQKTDQESNTTTPAASSLSLQNLRTSLGELEWQLLLLSALIMAVLWCSLFLSSSWLQFLAGMVPVSVGIFLGRKIKQHAALHGLVVGSLGFLFGLAIILVYGALGDAGIIPMPKQPVEPGKPPETLTFATLLLFYIQFSLFAMIPFPTFGTIISHRNEKRRRELNDQVTRRGGQLEQPGAVRTLEDLKGQSLPQFGGLVKNLFTKNKFAFQDYQFLDKDKYLDLEFFYEGEIYLARLSVVDTVRAGAVEKLVQDMQQRDIPKGIVITSTEFAADAHKSARGRPNILLIDGATVFEIMEH
jgi:hypothetical protein